MITWAMSDTENSYYQQLSEITKPLPTLFVIYP